MPAEIASIGGRTSAKEKAGPKPCPRILIRILIHASFLEIHDSGVAANLLRALRPSSQDLDRHPEIAALKFAALR